MFETTTVRITLVLLAVLLCGCFLSAQQKTQDPDAETMRLMELDKGMASASAATGVIAALLPHLSENSMLFPPEGHPIRGKTALSLLAAQLPADSKVQTLAWETLNAAVSADLGFTYCRYLKPDTKDYHYFATIWRKQDSQIWKIHVSVGLLNLEATSVPPLTDKIDPVGADPVVKKLLETEAAFCAYAGIHGIAAGFYNFMAEGGTALGPGGSPVSREFYAERLKKHSAANGPQPQLIWEAYQSIAATSGQLGCNYGPYVFVVAQEGGKVSRSYGYFITVWKKTGGQNGGEWRFVLDAGNRCTLPPGTVWNLEPKTGPGGKINQ